MTIEAAYVPPVKLNGAQPNLLSISVSRPVFVRDRWRISGRAYAQVGSISGDFTCAEAEIGNPSDAAFNCLEPSNDEISQRYLGLEMGLAGGDWLGPLEPHATVGLNYLDLEFQVRARYNEVTDRALLVTDGVTVFGTAGLSYPFGDGLSLSGEAFYSPLGVQGRNQGTDGIGEAQHSDGLFNVRVLISYRLR